MRPSTRWALVAAAAVAIAILLLLWGQREQPQPPAKREIAAPPPAPKPAVTPITPKPEAPLTALVLFDYDQSAVRAGEAAKLDELAARSKGRAFERVDAAGHADRIGSNRYNLRLSQRRADAARAYLVGKGMDAGRIRTEARGEEAAVTGDACKNMGPENRNNRKLIECLQRDRRVEVQLVVAR